MKKKKLWKAKQILRDNLQRQLPLLVSEYFESGRAALAPGTTWESMHQFRLQTKRFRYTLEIFREAYGPALGTRIESLRKIQTLLGDTNDYVVASAMVKEMPGMDGVQETLSGKAESKSAKLRDYWRKTFDAAGEFERWRSYLARYACRPKRSRTPASKASSQS